MLSGNNINHYLKIFAILQNKNVSGSLVWTYICKKSRNGNDQKNDRPLLGIIFSFCCCFLRCILDRGRLLLTRVAFQCYLPVEGTEHHVTRFLLFLSWAKSTKEKKRIKRKFSFFYYYQVSNEAKLFFLFDLLASYQL